MPTIPVNGTSLYYEVTGLGPPLVLVHGSWGDGRNWDAVVPALVERFAVLTYDRRGHSRSAPATAQGSMKEDALDLAALIETLGLDPANIAGKSYGAAIVLRLATLRPDLFRALAAHEPPLFGVLTMIRRHNRCWRRCACGSMRGPAARCGQPGGRRLRVCGDGGIRAGLLGEAAPVDAGRVHRQRAHLVRRDAGPGRIHVDLAALGRFPHPALVTRGENGPPFFAPIVAAIARALPRRMSASTPSRWPGTRRT